MSETIGNLYVRAESEEEILNSNGSPKKSTSLSSLRNLRDTFKRSESRTSQTSLATSSTRSDNNGTDGSPDKKPGEFSIQFSFVFFYVFLKMNAILYST